MQDRCHSLADKYIEYDPVIVMIDLVLLNEQAYRHVLYNSPFQVCNLNIEKKKIASFLFIPALEVLQQCLCYVWRVGAESGWGLKYYTI